MKGKPYIFLGASIRGRNPEESERIADHVRKIAAVLDELGFSYDSAILTNRAIFSGSAEQPKIPSQYLKMSKQLIKSVSGLRYHRDTEKIRQDIAIHRWSLDLIRKSIGCIWEGSRSYAGLGFEVAAALEMERHCLVLFDRPGANQTVSSILAGSTSRLLHIKQFKDESFREVIEKFCGKIQGALDKVIRFNVSVDMEKRLEEAVKRYEFSDRSEYIRFLIEQDTSKNEG